MKKEELKKFKQEIKILFDSSVKEFISLMQKYDASNMGHIEIKIMDGIKPIFWEFENQAMSVQVHSQHIDLQLKDGYSISNKDINDSGKDYVECLNKCIKDKTLITNLK